MPHDEPRKFIQIAVSYAGPKKVAGYERHLHQLYALDESGQVWIYSQSELDRPQPSEGWYPLGMRRIMPGNGAAICK